MRMKELMKASFKNHPVISTALNQHLFEHRVPMSEHEALLKRVATLEHQSSVQKRMVDSHANSISNLQRNRNRGGGEVMEEEEVEEMVEGEETENEEKII